ncbi:MAG: PAS domain-containing sensor histidine kinase [Spirochaetes bacterium]|nr:PAS domain-containing sensor histidine kinase [Spirochaetota bacterium]
MELNLVSLKESKDFLISVIDNISSALFLSDVNFHIAAFNETFSKLFHKNSNEIEGKLCGNIIGCVFVEETGMECGTSAYCSKCLLRKAVSGALESKNVTNNQILERHFYISGTKYLKYFRYSVIPILYNGEILALVIVDDVTEIESARRMLEEKNTELSKLIDERNRFLGMTAHDLRNPIGSVKTILSFIHDNYSETEREKILEFIDVSREASESALSLINDLLDISAIESGKIDLVKSEFVFTGLVESVIARNQLFAEKKNIKIILNDFSSHKTIMADKRRIDQLISNLLSNAVKYSPSGGEIIITLNHNSGFTVFSIKDSGDGISDEDKGKIFKPFGKAKVRTTGGEMSTGLGLAISKKIAEYHGGNISFESKKGDGSEFIFSLPDNS